MTEKESRSALDKLKDIVRIKTYDERILAFYEWCEAHVKSVSSNICVDADLCADKDFLEYRRERIIHEIVAFALKNQVISVSENHLQCTEGYLMRVDFLVDKEEEVE